MIPAWLNFRLSPATQRHPINPNILHPDWEIRSGVCVGGFRGSEKDYEGDYRIDHIQVTDLHSSAVPPPLALKDKFDHFIVDVIQGLVVLLEYIKASPTLTFARVHLRHITTGQPHPLARLPTITVRFQDLWRSPDPDLQIMTMANILLIRYGAPKNVSDCCVTAILDWQSCVLLGQIHSETVDADLAFLDKCHIFLYSSLPRSATNPRESNQVALLFYRIPTPTSYQQLPNADFDVHSYPRLTPVLILELPKLHDVYKLRGYTLASEQLLGSLAYRGSTKVIYSHTTTIALQLWLRHSSGHEVEQLPHRIDLCIFVNTGRIFDFLLETRKQGSMRVPWSQWGTAATRWFIDIHSPLAYLPTAYGSLCPIWDLDRHRMNQFLSILEFNPQITRRHIYTSGKTDGKTGSEGQGLASGYGSNMATFKNPPVSSRVCDANLDQDVVTEIVGSDTQTIIDPVFEEPVVSSLPYMVVTRVKPMPRHSNWFIEGDLLVGTVSIANDHLS
ncbi:unnamed protein product [Rhizoctonia solani]|uniref:Uncharacterized protein n=1 Tax=Rhizoctonia solani TaxID=456999 RepID=A0A8H3GSQ1_9AGAM|nr:unnamed protein product [Rhizoctonia solani]